MSLFMILVILVIEFCELHGSEYMEVLMHVSVRWLSLEQYEPLAASYFNSSSRHHISMIQMHDYYNRLYVVCTA